MDEIHEALSHMGYAFDPLNGVSSSGDRNDPRDGMRPGNRAMSNRLSIAEKLADSGLAAEWENLVQCVVSRNVPREPDEQGPKPVRFDRRARDRFRRD